MELGILYTNEIKWYNIILKVMGKPDVQAPPFAVVLKKKFKKKTNFLKLPNVNDSAPVGSPPQKTCSLVAIPIQKQ